MGITVYHYPRCGTCRKALKWLNDKDIDMNLIDIVENPPSRGELAELIKKSGLEVNKFFNTSGQVYKEMNLKEKLKDMTDEEKIDLLASNGKLIKRPIVTDGKHVTVGFNEEQFAETWGIP